MAFVGAFVSFIMSVPAEHSGLVGGYVPPILFSYSPFPTAAADPLSLLFLTQSMELDHGPFRLS